MSFLNNMTDLFGGFLKRSIAEYPANQVVEVKPEDYLNHQIFQREDCLLLYGAVKCGAGGGPPVAASGPGNSTTTESSSLFEIVLQKEQQSRSSNVAYSLCRAKTLNDCEVMYHLIVDKIPVIARTQPATICVTLLQDVLDYIREHRGQTLIHLATHFGYIDILRNILSPTSGDQDLEQATAVVNQQCSQTGLTPLHIAVKNGKLPIIQLLLQYKPNLELCDRFGNTALHTAGNTTKDIIEAICSCPPLFEQHVIPRLINRMNNDGYTPLHLACLFDRPDCVKALLKYGADVNGATMTEQIASQQQDQLPGGQSDSSFEYKAEVMDQLETRDMKNGGTPLHWARSCQVMETLISMGCSINGRNFQGETVLHVIVARNKFPLVVTLLSHGADVDARGPNGNTPLHIAVKGGDFSVVQALVVFGANLDIKNNAGESPRHVAAAIRRDAKQDQILYILNSCGARRCRPAKGSCNDGCSSSSSSNFNGAPPESSPFHRSEGLYDEIFGGSIVAAALAKKPNHWRSEPERSGSVSQRSSPDIEKARDAMELDHQSDEHEKSRTIDKKRGRVLCLDGGGIRGLVLVQMLSVIEQMTKRPITDYFDFIAGTSTGGILALSLCVGNSTSECRRLYFRLKDKVFVGSRPYMSEPLEQFLQETFGSDTRMSDIKWPRVCITATVADRFPADLHLFRNYASPEEILCAKLPNLEVRRKAFDEPFPPPEEQPIWSTARCTGAAPTYFRPQGRFIDGGLISNNPTLDALVEIQQMNTAYEHAKSHDKYDEKIELEVVVSLGTGGIPIHHVPILDVLRPDSFFGVAKMAFMASALGQLLIDQASQSDGQVVERARSWCNSIGVPYFRLNPPISENVPLDEANNARLVNMMWETTAYMHSKRAEIEQLLTLLLK